MPSTAGWNIEQHTSFHPRPNSERRLMCGARTATRLVVLPVRARSFGEKSFTLLSVPKRHTRLAAPRRNHLGHIRRG